MYNNSSFETDWCDVLIKRTKRRKSVSILVKDGKVQVNIPVEMSAVDVQILLEKKRAWIEKTIEQQCNALKASHMKLESGELFLYQGKRYPLKMLAGDRFHIHISNDNQLIMVCPESSNQVQKFEQILSWYHLQATEYLLEKTNHFAKLLGHHPVSVQIKSYRARWGSCSIQGKIQYNWRLIMAPPEVMDYVVVHELCHLLEHNHSSQFWQLVATFDKDYQRHRQWLKQYGDYLQLQLGKA